MIDVVFVHIRTDDTAEDFNAGRWHQAGASALSVIARNEGDARGTLLATRCENCGKGWEVCGLEGKHWDSVIFSAAIPPGAG